MTVYEELEEIRKRDGGILITENIVRFAENPNTALHARFNWDDTKAAHSYRLYQARALVRVFVEVVKTRGGNKDSRVYVALSSDRKTGGGYRVVADVLSDSEMKRVLLSDALADLERFREKYETIKELAGVFREFDKLKNGHSRKAVRASLG